MKIYASSMRRGRSVIGADVRDGIKRTGKDVRDASKSVMALLRDVIDSSFELERLYGENGAEPVKSQCEDILAMFNHAAEIMEEAKVGLAGCIESLEDSEGYVSG